MSYKRKYFWICRHFSNHKPIRFTKPYRFDRINQKLICICFLKFTHLLLGTPLLNLKPNKMTRILCLFAALVASLATFAQTPITLDKTNITGRIQGSFHWRIASATGVNSPTTGANQAWDYSSLKGAYQKGNLLAAPSYSTTAVQDTDANLLNYETSIDPHSFIQTCTVYDIDDQGLFYAGKIFPKTKATSESQFTGNIKDSTYFPPQYFQARENIIPFPATMGTSWVSKLNYTITLNMTAIDYGLNKTSGKIERQVFIKDTVVGWGTLKIPVITQPSIPYNVLLVRRYYVQIDSYFVKNGSTFQPAPPPLLTAYTVKQHDTTNKAYSEYFVRAGNGYPLLSIGYGNDETYTHVTSVSFDADNVKAGIENEDYNPIGLNIYPNPANSGAIHFQFTKNSGQVWRITIFNLIGQTVKTMKTEGTGNRDIQMDCGDFKPGMYFVNIIDESGDKVQNSKLQIVK